MNNPFKESDAQMLLYRAKQSSYTEIKNTKICIATPANNNAHVNRSFNMNRSVPGAVRRKLTFILSKKSSLNSSYDQILCYRSYLSLNCKLDFILSTLEIDENELDQALQL